MCFMVGNLSKEAAERLLQTTRNPRVLGPNQFLNQEPETNETLEDFCRINHGVTFPLSEKIDVNGPNAHPIFKFLKKEKGGFLFSTIKWNFTKFLVDQQGVVVKRYAPTVKPATIEADIKNLFS